MGSFSFYMSTIAVYFGIDVLSAWSLNLQYGYGGVLNFGWIMFQAAGAYIASVTVLGPSSSPNSYQSYVLGAHLPWPLPLLAAAAAGAVLALVIGAFALRSIRRDYQAAVMLVLSLIATQVVSADPALFNGANGLTGVTRPLFASLHISLPAYQWWYAVFVLLLCVPFYFFVEWLGKSSWGRALRAMRDHEQAAAAVGLNGTMLRLQVFVLGGAMAGLTGGLLVEFIGAWSPGAWGYSETLVLFTAILIGGVSNNRGVVLGTLLIPILVLQVTQFLPQFGFTGLIDGLQWILIGLAWMIGLLVRPRGIFPERRLVERAPGSVTPTRRWFNGPSGHVLASGLTATEASDAR